MNKFHQEPGKKTVFYGVLALFLLSVAVLVYGLVSEKSNTEIFLPDNSEIVKEAENDTSLNEYFENVPSSNSEENTDLYYLETDPFREKCESEGGTFGNKCYY